MYLSTVIFTSQVKGKINLAVLLFSDADEYREGGYNY